MPTDRSAITWTTTQLLADVRRKASLPVTSTDWTDAVILREATDVLWSFAGWALSQAGEGRLLASLDRPVTGALTGAAGQREFLIPPLAIASTIDMVTWTDSTGQNMSKLVRIDHADEATWTEPMLTGAPAYYALLADRIRIFPLANSGGTLRVTYQRRLPELVTDAQASVGTVTTITSGSSTTSSILQSSGIIGVSVGDVIDVMRQHHPYALIMASVEVTSIPNGNTLVVDQPVSYATGIEALGARVVRAGQSPYVPLPLELRTCFAEKTAANILRTLGDLQGMQAAEQSATLELARVMQMLSPRAKRDKPYAVNPFSHLRMRITRGR